MILVIGGFAAGKRTYVREELGYTDAQMADAALDGRPVVYNAQDMALTRPAGELADALAEKDVVISCEVGAGIVPIDPQERRFREAAGRLNALLARRADRVVRVVCGLPQVIKG